MEEETKEPELAEGSSSSGEKAVEEKAEELEKKEE